MAKDPAFLFYSSDFLTGVIDMTMEERGQYITLMCLQHQKGHLSEKTIRFCLGSVSDNVMSKFKQDEDGLYYNSRLDAEINQRVNFVASRRENGKKGGRPKADEKTIRFDVGLPTENLRENENEDEIINESVGDIEKCTTRARKKSQKEKVFLEDDKAYKAAAYLAACICKRLPSQKPADERRLQSWAAAFDKCHRIDGQSWEDIARVLKFSQEDPFWQQNILSAAKFREKYVQLLAKMKSTAEGRRPSASAKAMSDLQQIHEMFSEEDG